MARPIIHAVFIALLFGIGLWLTFQTVEFAGYSVYMAEFHDTSTAPVTIGLASSIIGGCGVLACLVLCSIGVRGLIVYQWLPLLAPVVCLLVSGTTGMLRGLGMFKNYTRLTAAETTYSNRFYYLAGESSEVMLTVALGLLWAGLAFASVVAVAGCVGWSAKEQRTPDKINKVWMIVGLAVALSGSILVATGYGRVWARLLDIGASKAWYALDRTFAEFGCPGGPSLLMPILLALMSLVVFPLLLWRVRWWDTDDGGPGTSTDGLAQSLGLAGTLGAGLCLAAAALVHASGTTLAFGMALDRIHGDYFENPPGISLVFFAPHRLYHGVTPVAWLVATVTVLVVVVLVVRMHKRQWRTMAPIPLCQSD